MKKRGHFAVHLVIESSIILFFKISNTELARRKVWIDVEVLIQHILDSQVEEKVECQERQPQASQSSQSPLAAQSSQGEQKENAEKQ